MGLSLGNGRKLKFWKDIWLAQASLAQSFPLCFSFSTKPECCVVDFWKPDQNGATWDLAFRRDLWDWKIWEAGHLLELLDHSNFLNEDSTFWIPDSSSNFSVSSCYWQLQKMQNVAIKAVYLPVKVIRDAIISARICFFMWELANRALFNKVKLKRILGVQNDLCLLCNNEPGILTHLLFTCSYTKEIWLEFASGFHIAIHEVDCLKIGCRTGFTSPGNLSLPAGFGGMPYLHSCGPFGKKGITDTSIVSRSVGGRFFSMVSCPSGCGEEVM